MNDKPETDAGQLRVAADWLDVFDAMALQYWDLLEETGRASADDLVRVRAATSSNEVQTDLRRIADKLDWKGGE